MQTELPKPARLERQRPWLLRHLAETQIFTTVELRRLLALLREEEALPTRVTFPSFLSFLLDRCDLRRVDFVAEGHAKTGEAYKTITRYAYGKVSPYALGLALRSGAYLTHATAVLLHGLTDELPKTIFVNKEQTPKPKPTGGLTQAGIDRAFANKARESNYTFSAEGYRYVILSGKNTGRLEVSPMPRDGESLDATRLERTLIDIAVRPNYAGGPHQVLDAYRRARARMSLGVLLATLRKLDYQYPYHQAIGFYMSRAGFDTSQLQRLRSIGITFDFYLANAMKLRDRDSLWRVFYPPGL